jgi:anti-sigma regulatory factor (Ser/Thr protein kinase)
MSAHTPFRPTADHSAAVRASSPLEVRLPARIEAVPEARHELARWLSGAPVSREIADEFALVVTELVTNAVEASPGPRAHIAVRARLDPHEVVLLVSDEGEGFHLVSSPSLPSSASVRGRGLPIVSALMDEMTINRRDGRTEVEVSRRLPPADR